MDALQISVVFSTTIITVMSAILAVFLIFNYRTKKKRSYLFWSIGIWIFTLGAALETLFAFGIFNKDLISFYLFIAAVIVEMLALGSIQLVRTKSTRSVYYIYCAITTFTLAFSIIYSHIGNIITKYVVSGILPSLILIASSLVTIPGAIILITIAAMNYKKGKSKKKMLDIIIGTVILSMGGVLYITAIPEFLYFVEFVGISILWFGFKA